MEIGSLNIAYQFYKKGVLVVGVPKTIDNDLSATEVTFGFNTAVDTATEASTDYIPLLNPIIGVMILKHGQICRLDCSSCRNSRRSRCYTYSEIPYDINRIKAKIADRYIQGKKFSIMVVAEGAKPKDGEMVVQKLVPTSHDPVRLGGTGNKVAQEIEEIIELKPE